MDEGRFSEAEMVEDSVFEAEMSEGSISETESESEAVWVDIVNEVYDELDAEFQEKMQNYIEQGYEDARERALDDMFPTYMRRLKKVFSKYFTYAQRLEKSDNYQTILEDFNNYIEEKNGDFSKALKAAIRKNKPFFEELLESGEEEDENESDVEEENESSDKESDMED